MQRFYHTSTSFEFIINRKEAFSMTDPAVPEASIAEPLSARIEERTVGPCRVLMLKTPVQAVVSWHGSFTAYPDFGGGDELVQTLAVQLLDKGTRDRDRFAIAEVLENRGAQIHFTSDTLRVSFQGRALRDDVPEVLRIMAEELRRPLFDAAEFEKAKARYKASLQRSLENTASQAGAALARRLYSPAHPNHIALTEETIARLDALTVEPVRAYHARHFGARNLLLIFVGDIDVEAVEQAMDEAFGDWPTHEAPASYQPQATPVEPGRVSVFMPDKLNLDVRMGHALSLRRSDPDFMPLFVGNYILGGNFSARLMNKIRDEMGLTYGISARLSGITTDYEGHWVVGVTLSQENVERGIVATLDEVRRFVDEGPTADELKTKQTTITGSFKVGLATTGKLAATLHRQAVQGFGVDYLERFPQEVEAVTLDQIREAVARHFRPEAFQTALAGTLPDAEDDRPKP